MPFALLNDEARSFLAGVVVDHIDGVMAEDLIAQHFTTRPLELA